MMARMCNVADCLWTDKDKFCTVLKKAAVPLDEKWPLLILYLRGIRENSLLSEVQKAKMQEVLLSILQEKDFSDQKYEDTQRLIHAVLSAPYEQKLSEVAREASELTKEVNNILGKRKQDVMSVTKFVDADLASGKEPASILAGLRDALKDVVAKMEQDTHTLTDLSHKDSLTGLANRRSFDIFLNETVDLWKTHETPSALILFDIDNFKKFNDTYGHLVGDQVLRTLARQVEKKADSLRSDSTQVLAARYGGEEFTIILRGEAAARAVSIAEEIRKAIKAASLLLRDASNNVVESGLQVTVSLGVSHMWTGWAGAFDTNLIDCADKALYHAKHSGRNCTVQYTPEKKTMYTVITS